MGGRHRRQRIPASKYLDGGDAVDQGYEEVVSLEGVSK